MKIVFTNIFFYFQISYIRKSDFHILTNGHTVYTRDKRFQIFHAAKSHDWILLIKNVGYNDSGIYECQVSINITYDIKSNENNSYSLGFGLVAWNEGILQSKL